MCERKGEKKEGERWGGENEEGIKGGKKEEKKGRGEGGGKKRRQKKGEDGVES